MRNEKTDIGSRMPLIGVFAVTVLSAVSRYGVAGEIDQSKICIVSTDQEALECRPGELMYFQPRTWGNEQLATRIAALYCDFNYRIMHTPASVICVYTNARTYLLKRPK